MWFYPVFSTFSEGSLFRLAIVANVLYMKIKIASTSSPEVAPSCLGGGGGERRRLCPFSVSSGRFNESDKVCNP